MHKKKMLKMLKFLDFSIIFRILHSNNNLKRDVTKKINVDFGIIFVTC